MSKDMNDIPVVPMTVEDCVIFVGRTTLGQRLAYRHAQDMDVRRIGVWVDDREEGLTRIESARNDCWSEFEPDVDQFGDSPGGL